MTIDIKLDDREVRRALRRIAGALADPSPAMRAIATHLADRAEDAFETQASTDSGGMPWPALKPATERARKGSGHVPITILQRSGALVRSILADDPRPGGVPTGFLALRDRIRRLSM